MQKIRALDSFQVLDWCEKLILNWIILARFILVGDCPPIECLRLPWVYVLLFLWDPASWLRRRRHYINGDSWTAWTASLQSNSLWNFRSLSSELKIIESFLCVSYELVEAEHSTLCWSILRGTTLSEGGRLLPLYISIVTYPIIPFNKIYFPLITLIICKKLKSLERFTILRFILAQWPC